MKLILTQEVTGLGEPGDVVDVKDGYGRNFLLPRRLATPWTKGVEAQVASIRGARKAREIATLEEAQQVRATLQQKSVTLTARAGQSGRLFGAVTPGDIAEALVASGAPSGRPPQGRHPPADQVAGPLHRQRAPAQRRHRVHRRGRRRGVI